MAGMWRCQDCTHYFQIQLPPASPKTGGPQLPDLIHCPACDKVISLQAKHCPSCGHPIQARNEFEEKSNFVGMIIIVVIVVVLALLLLLDAIRQIS